MSKPADLRSQAVFTKFLVLFSVQMTAFRLGDLGRLALAALVAASGMAELERKI